MCVWVGVGGGGHPYMCKDLASYPGSNYAREDN